MNRPASGFAVLLAVFGLAFISACASSGGGESGGTVGRDSGRGTIEIQIWNRSDETVEVLARWGGARARLGQLSGNRRGTYLAYVQGPMVAISWNVLTARPIPATGTSAFPDIADSPGEPQCPVDVTAGDRIEWTIEPDSRTCNYIRLDPGTFD